MTTKAQTKATTKDIQALELLLRVKALESIVSSLLSKSSSTLALLTRAEA